MVPHIEYEPKKNYTTIAFQFILPILCSIYFFGSELEKKDTLILENKNTFSLKRNCIFFLPRFYLDTQAVKSRDGYRVE